MAESGNTPQIKTVDGDLYAHTLSTYIKKHDVEFAKGSHAPSLATVLTLGILGSTQLPPLVLTMSTHHLYYLLLQFEELDAIPSVGALDVPIKGGLNATRPVLRHASSSDNTSLVPSLAWQSPSWLRFGGKVFDHVGDMKFIYSCFTRLPSLRVNELVPVSILLADAAAHAAYAQEKQMQHYVNGFTDCPPPHTGIPMYAFKNLQSLVVEHIDPRSLIGWDVLSMNLISLQISACAVEDIGEILCDAVVEDLALKAGQTRALGYLRHARQYGGNPSQGTGPESGAQPQTAGDAGVSLPNAQSHGAEDTQAPGSNTAVPSPGESPSSTHGQVPENGVELEDNEAEPTAHATVPLNPPSITPTKPYIQPPDYAWMRLRHLAVTGSSLTFVPSEPLTMLSNLTSLDLSSNLLVSVPPGLSQLHSLRALDLSNNMIDSLIGISKTLGNIQAINLSHNRIDNISGLDRIFALERIDLRNNFISEALEISRLAVLPCLKGVWIEHNVFSRPVAEGGEERYRIKCFTYFYEEGNGKIQIDGSGPSMAESMYLAPPNQAKENSTPSKESTPVVKELATPKIQKHKSVHSSHTEHSRSPIDKYANSTHSTPKRKHKPKRIVDLDGSATKHSSAASGLHSNRADESEALRKKIEALRNEVGQSWLSVLSETRLQEQKSAERNAQLVKPTPSEHVQRKSSSKSQTAAKAHAKAHNTTGSQGEINAQGSTTEAQSYVAAQASADSHGDVMTQVDTDSQGDVTAQPTSTDLEPDTLHQEPAAATAEKVSSISEISTEQSANGDQAGETNANESEESHAIIGSSEDRTEETAISDNKVESALNPGEAGSEAVAAVTEVIGTAKLEKSEDGTTNGNVAPVESEDPKREELNETVDKLDLDDVQDDVPSGDAEEEEPVVPVVKTVKKINKSKKKKGKGKKK